jgi:hypothetical protein
MVPGEFNCDMQHRNFDSLRTFPRQWAALDDVVNRAWSANASDTYPALDYQRA